MDRSHVLGDPCHHGDRGRVDSEQGRLTGWPAGGSTRCRHQPPNFSADIKPLFRERDRRAMTFLFDLWDYEAVKENAEAILAATEGGDMPCDGAWSVERVEILRRWIEGGCQP
jgi:hypothetical protein